MVLLGSERFVFEPVVGRDAAPLPAQECWRAVAGGRELARLSLWWQGTPPQAGERIGSLGALSARNPEAAEALLRHACARLAARGCTRALAPMDGNTWGAYRCRLQAPLGFAGEPAPGPEWLPVLAAAGFREQARYLSSRCDDLGLRRLAPHGRRRLAGVRLLPAAGLDAAALLPGLQALVGQAFAQQPWFLPLDPPAFARVLHTRLAADPASLPLLACDGEEPVGLLLGHRRGGQLVVRTLAVRPGFRHAGLGALLLEKAHAMAQAAGCCTAIHALMVEGGASQALSRHYARPVARYALLGRQLG